MPDDPLHSAVLTCPDISDPLVVYLCIAPGSDLDLSHPPVNLVPAGGRRTPCGLFC